MKNREEETSEGGAQSKFKGKKGGRQNKEKFNPGFKKKTPTWKRIEEESKELLPKYEAIDSNKVKSFQDFPLCKRTMDGLSKANYTVPTEIQRETIGLALKGYDVLGAAKTGSGKTLAFLVPILEILYNAKWTKYDGLGVLIVSPTRELAYQTFEVLKKIGKFHDFSAGLVIGGKDLKTESKIINQTSIIVCTPGRLLQHMDETWNFNCDNLKVLVLDEADRILDLGFAETMNSIIENLPKSRQTLLFSATQTKNVKDLARLSLNNPAFVSVHEHSAMSTPKNLTQNYVVCDTHDKLSFLWSFIRNHLNQKIIVFFQSCKQVKFVYETFTKLQTGMTTLALYGTMNQIRRMTVYDQFCRKSHAVLFATDIAARGLDFPSINWVIQCDCPPDANTYIHRVGRTARYEKDGQAILLLTPGEEPEMMAELQKKKIPITRIEANMKRIININPKLQSLCAGNVEIKESAKRALMAYMRSIYLMSNKKIFKVDSIDLPKFSESLGLVVAPRLRFIKRSNQAKNGAENGAESGEEGGSGQESEEGSSEDEAARGKDSSGAFSNLVGNQDEDGDDDLFTVRRSFTAKPAKKGAAKEKEKDEEEEEDDEDDEDLPEFARKIKIKSKAAVVKAIKKKNLKVNEKVQFDDEGNVIRTNINQRNFLEEYTKEEPKEPKPVKEKKAGEKDYGGIDIDEAKEFLKREQEVDKKLFRERIKREHREKRYKEKDLRRAKRAKTTEKADEFTATLKTDDDFDNQNDDDDDAESGEE